jgi:uncharacterized protein (TIGR02145 family)
MNTHPEYGLLYTWAAASGRTDTNADTPNDLNQTRYQGICPAGWHLPNDYEWNQLEEVIAKSAAGVYSTTEATAWESDYSTKIGYRGTHGEKMRSKTKVNGQEANGTSNGFTANGFNALLVGNLDGGSAYSYGTYTDFWSSSADSDTAAWRRGLSYNNSGAYRAASNKYYLFSVRCKKN